MSDSSNETIGRIEEQLDGPVIVRLALHAAQKLDRLWWQGVLGGEPPGGVKAVDFVHNAIEKTLRAAQGQENGRNWDYTNQPDLFAHLRSVIDSDISHLVKGWENRNFRSQAALRKTDDGDEVDIMEITPSEAPTPSQVSTGIEQEREREAVLFGFCDFLADDPQLQKSMELIFDGITKPAEQAERLGLTQKQMYVVTRRMRRRIDEFKLKNAKMIAEVKAHA